MSSDCDVDLDGCLVVWRSGFQLGQGRWGLALPFFALRLFVITYFIKNEKEPLGSSTSLLQKGALAGQRVTES